MNETLHVAASAAIADCWNSIGVRGDASCPELKAHIHCRNCPIYAQAAVRRLDAEPPDGYRSDWTSHVAKPKGLDARDTQSIVIFRIRGEWLALPAPAVVEVADVRPVHSLPHRRGTVILGVASIRGELLVCVSLVRLLALDGSPAPARKGGRAIHERLLVLRGDAIRAVCHVDEVHGIHRVQPRELKDVPATVAGTTGTYSKHVLSWNDRSVGLIDAGLLFYALKRSFA